MNVGVLTFHRALNYGAVLQCFALCSVLRGMGHDVSVVDYRQAAIEHTYKPVRWKWLMKKVVRPWTLPAYFRHISWMREHHRRYKRFRDAYWSETSPCDASSIPDGFDAYVVGSDQLWEHKITGRADPVYHGDFRRPSRSTLVGYAVSCTESSISSLGCKAQEYVDNFDAFSFREKALADCFRHITGGEIPTVIDPTLLTDCSAWEGMLNPAFAKRNFVAFYQVRFLSGQQDLLRKRAEVLADSIGAELLDLSSGEMEVGDFVSAIRYARCVVTSSFHGTAFSLIFQRPFYSYVLNDGHDSRYVDLLQEVGLDDALVGVDFIPRTVPAYDLAAAAGRLSRLRDASLAFLKDGITNKSAK